MAKSPDAFRTISEVSEWLDTPAHVLRFWESKFTQIKPVKRAGGRRYYRPEDMALLGGIKTLLHEQGMTIKGVQKLLREQGVRHVAALGPQPLDAYEADEIAGDVAPTPEAPPLRIIPAAPLPEVPPRAAPAPTAAAVPRQAVPPMPPDASPEAAGAAPETTPALRFGFAPATPPVTAPAAPPRPRRGLPDLPPEPVATPGILSAILSRDPAALSHRAARLAPVVARLGALRDRLRATT